ncbi:DUF4123 domain-containing protein [Geomonas oryzisoli]|uniref:DUF4123 domain-containing protein n=1 Tax=Geomonas oryzisoli TaxID=2847992 RepID=A0ABX8J835_9BACT|nr:DUF4123 domain-containing protein [Geomonas oryzisoli]QWV94609.1 DUF4123 domain-containing protein [Geomonas oryzisoli]
MESLEELVFATDSSSVFCILDGAVVPDLPSLLASLASQHFCLLRGALSPDLAQVAPYLVFLRRDCRFTDWLLAQGWGRNWGIYGGSGGSMIELRKHFRHVFHVSDQSGKPYYFRFYDPCVLRHYLPRCTDKELAQFFGPVQWFLVEERTPGTARKFFRTGNALREDRIAVAQPHQRVGEVSWRFESSR